MKNYDVVFRYLEQEYVAEIEEHAKRDINKNLKFVYNKAREFYWTVTRLLGFGGLHDGAWREPGSGSAEKLRTELTGDIPAPASCGRLLIDMTPTHRLGRQTGIQRVVREIARAGVESGAALPVFIKEGRLHSHFKHPALPNEVAPSAGDRLLLLDASWPLLDEYVPVIDATRRAGGKVVCALYDLIPLRFPSLVPTRLSMNFPRWFQSVVLESDGVICISRTVAEDLLEYLREQSRALAPGARVGYWRLGADFRASKAEPSAAAAGIARGAAPFFLSVGTLEPRKGYSVALNAFEALWREGVDVRYVIVGRPGWNTLALQRRIHRHAELGKRLFWLHDAPDADLHYLYPQARALVFASFAEGFGLPLVEAAHFGARLVASDIPVFREVGGDAAAYFDMLDAASLAARLKEALAETKPARPLQALSWRQSAQALFALLGGAPSPHGGWLDDDDIGDDEN